MMNCYTSKRAGVQTFISDEDTAWFLLLLLVLVAAKLLAASSYAFYTETERSFVNEWSSHENTNSLLPYNSQISLYQLNVTHTHTRQQRRVSVAMSARDPVTAHHADQPNTACMTCQFDIVILHVDVLSTQKSHSISQMYVKRSIHHHHPTLGWHRTDTRPWESMEKPEIRPPAIQKRPNRWLPKLAGRLRPGYLPLCKIALRSD